jgi:hypothetical protein
LISGEKVLKNREAENHYPAILHDDAKTKGSDNFLPPK